MVVQTHDLRALYLGYESAAFSVGQMAGRWKKSPKKV